MTCLTAAIHIPKPQNAPYPSKLLCSALRALLVQNKANLLLNLLGSTKTKHNSDISTSNHEEAKNKLKTAVVVVAAAVGTHSSRLCSTMIRAVADLMMMIK